MDPSPRRQCHQWRTVRRFSQQWPPRWLLLLRQSWFPRFLSLSKAFRGQRQAQLGPTFVSKTCCTKRESCEYWGNEEEARMGSIVDAVSDQVKLPREIGRHPEVSAPTGLLTPLSTSNELELTR